MSRVCARCFAEFRGTHALGLLWCTVDRFFVCRRCWEDRCSEGHGKGAKNLSNRGISALGMLAMVTIVAAPWAGMVAYDYIVLMEWVGAPVLSIDSLRPGEISKVAGVIVSNASIVFGGREVHTDAGWAWRWDPTGSFSLMDQAGTIFVTMDEWWDVAPGLHPAPNAVRTTGTVYMPGDTVYIWGKVADREDGTPSLIVRILSPSPSSPEPSLTLLALILLLAGPLVPFWIWAGFWWYDRGVLHRRAVLGVSSVLVPENIPRDPTLTWRTNRKRFPVGRRKYVVIGVLATFASLVILSLAIPGLHERSEEVVLALVLSIGGLMLVVLPLLWMGFAGAIPSAVAFSDQGFHVWYDDQYERRLNDDFIAWTQVRTIEFRDAGKYEKYWYLERTTGEGENLDRLSPENLIALRDEWKRRKESGRNAPQAPDDS